MCLDRLGFAVSILGTRSLPYANRYLVNNTVFVKGSEIEFGKESTGASTVARDRERVKRAWHEDRD